MNIKLMAEVYRLGISIGLFVGSKDTKVFYRPALLIMVVLAQYLSPYTQKC